MNQQKMNSKNGMPTYMHIWRTIYLCIRDSPSKKGFGVIRLNLEGLIAVFNRLFPLSELRPANCSIAIENRVGAIIFEALSISRAGFSKSSRAKKIVALGTSICNLLHFIWYPHNFNITAVNQSSLLCCYYCILKPAKNLISFLTHSKSPSC